MFKKLPDKRYYSIGEIAQHLSVNPSLLRFWEKEFDIIQPKKNSKGNRMFTPDDVKNLQMIFHLVKERGYTLDGAKTHLKTNIKEPADKIDLLNKLKLIKEDLLHLKNSL